MISFSKKLNLKKNLLDKNITDIDSQLNINGLLIEGFSICENKWKIF